MHAAAPLDVSLPAADTAPAAESVSLRRLPFPYRGMLAICSDLDETPDWRAYVETQRFLNTTETTRIGPGVGLEVGNTIYFDMPRDQFAYWNTDDEGRARLRALIQSGHVDCLHSFGDLATTRAHAGRALDELARHDCRLSVWIDHAIAPTNFGEDIMRGAGDLPGSPVYHADLTLGFGIRYVWRGRVTSVIGQDVPANLAGVFDVSHPAASAMTLAKEAAKAIAARRGSRKYAMHAPNRTLRRTVLRDGQAAHEFLRANPHWAGVNRGETAAGLGDVLTERTLTRLVDSGGSCILYTHLGKVSPADAPFPPRARDGLRRLADRARRGDILVTTTRRLLGYADARQHVRATLTRGSKDRLDLTSDHGVDPDLQGLTFYVPEPQRTDVFYAGRRVAATPNGADAIGPPSLSIPWKPLTFPAI
jgi:hypothetical protein